MRYLKPGEIYFGDDAGVVRTLLGSCVAVTLWHARLGYGGMCHVVLPSATTGEGHADPRYAEGAMAYFLRCIHRVGTRCGDYEVGLYGGGVMFSGRSLTPQFDIGRRNVEAMEQQLRRHGFVLTDRRVGGGIYRSLSFDLRRGEVQVVERSVPAAIDSLAEKIS